jgi:hypothetical protein
MALKDMPQINGVAVNYINPLVPEVFQILAHPVFNM